MPISTILRRNSEIGNQYGMYNNMTNYEKGGGQIQLGQVLLQVARLGCEGAITSLAITQKTTLGEGLGGGASNNS